MARYMRRISQRDAVAKPTGRDRRRVLLLVLWLSLFAVEPAASGETWAFLWAEAGRNDYQVRQGSAIVTLKDGTLKATMRIENKTELMEFIVTGSVSDGTVRAKVTIGASEFLDVPFRGTHVVRRWEEVFEGSTGTESIVLTDGINVLAFSRDLFRPPGETPPPRDR